MLFHLEESESGGLKQMQIGEASGTSGGESALSLNDFEIIEKLGKGSFGAVFLVKKRDDPE